jgi:hypothetical protein
MEIDMAAKVNLEMSIKCYKKLADFLEGHEYEIATEENAYGELRELFIHVFDVEPTEDC